MKKAALYLFLCLSLTTISAQNLVNNGSFEDKKYCPVNFNQQQLNQIDKWGQTGTGTPDYFHECSKKAGVPDNLFGSLEANEGKAYAGLVSYSSTSRNYREYLQTKLTRPLGAGETICVEYFVSTADKSLYVTDGIGFYFTEKKLKGKRDKVIEAKPQIRNLNLNILDSYGSWIKISDVFTAEGGEEYLTIGNFYPDNRTSILMRNGVGNSLNRWAYIYVDDIVVKPVKSKDECSCVNDIIAKTIYDPPLELEEYTKIDLKSVLFDFDESIITSEAVLELNKVIELLYVNDQMFLQIIGHADIVGSGEYNVGLSEKRAQRVISYFKEKGIDEKRLKLDFKGSKDPIASNDTSDGRKQNRRVEFEILEYKYTLQEIK